MVTTLKNDAYVTNLKKPEALEKSFNRLLRKN